ncbi:MAG: Gfo/Idh/MocA family oxidoreductase [Firmicutes bacterium]|nr:Gfo/Idh/MocA family oxidoreductase [Bacillota bacterium]
MSKLRFGIIGCGNIARRFTNALHQSDVAEPLACASRDAAKAEAFAKDNGIPKSYGSYQVLLDDDQIQAVYIATVHNTHADIAKQCILAGKAVICEKPFFINKKEAEETIALAREKNVLIMEGFWTRTMPAYLKAKQWIKEGKIGDLHLIRASFCFNMPYNEQFKNSRIWNPATAGGALLDAGVYPYEYVTGIMDGYPDELKTIVQRAETGVDATVTLSMRYANGVVADCLTSVAGWMDSTAILSGTKGYIKQYYFLGCRKTELYQGRDELVETYEDPVEEGFVHEIAHFADLYQAGKTESDLIPLADTLNFAEVAEQILYFGDGSKNRGSSK